MRSILYPLSALLAGALAVGAAGCGGDDQPTGLPRGVAAKVGNTVIREPAVQAQMDVVLARRDGNERTLGPPNYPACIKAHRDLGTGYSVKVLRRQCRTEYDIARAQAVNDLVRDQWLTREIKRRGFDRDAVVRKATDRARSLWGKAADRTAIGADDLDFRLNALWEALVAATPATGQEIEEYGRANADVYYGTERRKAYFLQTDTKAKVAKARKRLENTATWSQIYKTYPRAPHNWTGVQTIAEASTPHDAVGRSLFSAGVGQLIGPVRNLNGWFIFQVINIRPPKYKGLSPRERRSVELQVKGKTLENTLLHRYTQQTSCAKKYIIPEAPNCHEQLPES